MNFKNILKEIEKTDPATYSQLSDRRNVLKSFGAKAAVAALPFAVGSLFNKVQAKTTGEPTVDALNFMLKLEYFQYNFYHTANNTGGLIPVADQPGFQKIEAHQKAHITLLANTVTNLGWVPFTPKFYNAGDVNPMYVQPAYDFTANGAYLVFSNYNTFLQLAQTFEDTAVHAYKGLLPAFFAYANLTTMVMQMQCVEARHSAFIRTIRRLYSTAGAPEYPAPWISNNIPTTIPFQSFYVGEDNTSQFGVEITSLPDTYDSSGLVPKISATAAFDEILDTDTVSSLIAPFIVL
jgi:hypothetical protein